MSLNFRCHWEATWASENGVRCFPVMLKNWALSNGEHLAYQTHFSGLLAHHLNVWEDEVAGVVDEASITRLVEAIAEAHAEVVK